MNAKKLNHLIVIAIFVCELLYLELQQRWAQEQIDELRNVLRATTATALAAYIVTQNKNRAPNAPEVSVGMWHESVGVTPASPENSEWRDRNSSR